MTKAQAQNLVTGRVISADDKTSLPGVSVRVKDASSAVATDQKGNYRITLPQGAVSLVFSFVGYKAQEIPVGSRQNIDVILAPLPSELNEVVVIGYGTVKKRDLTGSVSQVAAKEIDAFPTTSVVQALSGRAAGVQVLQNTGAPGAAVSVRIRGTNSIQGNNEPLYVVDGFPVNGSPSGINNADIQNIEILKDASATAIYGSRGANGVVLITTKHGKSGKTLVDFETSYSSQTRRKKLKMMNAQEYASFYNEQAANDKVAPYFTEGQINSFGQGFDWQDLVFQTAPMANTAVNVNGGNDKTQFSVRGSTVNQQGIIKNSSYNRYSLGFNLNHDISKMFNISLSSVLSRAVNGRLNDGKANRGGSLYSAAISAPPTLTPYNADGSYRVLGTAYSFISGGMINPLNYINEQSDAIKDNRLLTNAAITFKPIPELAVKLTGGIENSDQREDAYTTRNFVNNTGAASVNTSQFTSLLSEGTVSYTKTFNRNHSFSAVVGFSYQNFLNTSLGASGIGFINDNAQTYDLGSASTPGIPSSGYSKSVIISYLGRLNYYYKDKYLATVSFRGDGSSKYSAGNKWGYFPSFALAWRMSDEDFIKKISLISDMKLRLGWGNTGSQAISAYSSLGQLIADKTVFGDALYTTYAPGTQLAGPLKWETTEQENIGLDLGLMKNRLYITADYYIKNTRDLLNSVSLPSSLGYTTTIQNIGQLQNRGLEFAVDYKILTGTFKWNVNANIAFNRNRVVKLANDQDVLGGRLAQAIVVDDTNILREGRPIGQFYGYVENGYDSKGNIAFKDLDGDGVITQNDRTYIGNPNPKFIYGFSSGLSFKNFELSFFIQGSQGNDIFNVSAINNTVDFGYGLNMPEDVYLNHWTPTNTNAKYPVISRAVLAKVSNRFVEDGSYLRLKNIQLAYNLSGSAIKAAWLRNVQVYVSGQNLLTFTKYSWWDPEVNSNGSGSSVSQGIDWYSYPTAKTVTIGMRVGF